MAKTQAVYYQDAHGVQPVDEFIAGLLVKPAAKIDFFIEEYLNGRAPEATPPAFPFSTQIEGKLRELRVSLANTRYRVLYQRSDNLIVLLHAFEKSTESVSRSDIAIAQQRMADFTVRMDARRRVPPRAAGRDAPSSTR